MPLDGGRQRASSLMLYLVLTAGVAGVVVVLLRGFRAAIAAPGAAAGAAAAICWTIAVLTGNLILLYLGGLSALFAVVTLAVSAATAIQNRRRRTTD